MDLSSKIRMLAANFIGLYSSPGKVFERLAKSPDLFGALVLVSLSIVLQFVGSLAATSNLYFRYSNGTMIALSTIVEEVRVTQFFLSMLGIVSLWILGFVVYWYVANSLGGSLLGASALSVSGYMIGVKLPYLAYFTLFYWASSSTSIIIDHVPGLYVEMPHLLSMYLRGTVLSCGGFPLFWLILVWLSYFYFAFSVLLSVLFFMRGAGLTAKKAIAAGIGVSVLMFIVGEAFRAVGIPV